MPDCSLPSAPLSWSFRPEMNGLRFKALCLTSSIRFIPYAQYGEDLKDNLADTLRKELLAYPTVLKGLGEELAVILHNDRYLFHSFGQEARIALQDYDPSPSLKALAARALRKGSLRSSLSGHSIHHHSFSKMKRSPVELRGLFRRIKTKVLSVFQFLMNDEVVAEITCSRTTSDSFHLELMNRSKQAPVGAMEALVLQCIQELSTHFHAKCLSLGEVPSKHSFALSPGFGSTGLAFTNQFGHYFLQKSYGPGSLYSFKNKFSPSWRPVYWALPRKRATVALFLTGRVTGINRLLIDGGRRLVKAA